MKKKLRPAHIRYLILMIYPWVLCVIYCLVRGTSLNRLYLPSAYNNDDLIYYKLVEGLLNGGIKGYFGYNESHALMGGFGAWSPVILMPWLIWGCIFGWNYFSPMLANMVFFGLALCIYAGLSKEKFKNIALMLVIFSLFPSLPIHLLNALPETCVASLMIMYFAFMVRIEKGLGGKGCITGQVIIACLLTLMRPYMIILMIYPCYRLINRKAGGRYIISAIIMMAPLIGYFLIGKYFTSPYFRPLFDTGLIVLIRLHRFKDAWLTLAADTSFRMSELGRFIREAFGYGLTAGTQYVVAILMVLSAAILSLGKGRENKRRVYASYIICVIAVLGAIIFLLGYINEGGRHIWALAIVGIVLVCDSDLEKRGLIIYPGIGLILVIFLMHGALVPTDYDIPIEITYDRHANAGWEQEFAAHGINPAGEAGYENTFIWVMNDKNERGEMVMLNYHELFAIPAGMGINCCLPEYITENWGKLNSRYMAVPTGCYIDGRCNNDGYYKVGSSDKVSIYRIN